MKPTYFPSSSYSWYSSVNLVQVVEAMFRWAGETDLGTWTPQLFYDSTQIPKRHLSPFSQKVKNTGKLGSSLEMTPGGGKSRASLLPAPVHRSRSLLDLTGTSLPAASAFVSTLILVLVDRSQDRLYIEYYISGRRISKYNLIDGNLLVAYVS